MMLLIFACTDTNRTEVKRAFTIRTVLTCNAEQDFFVEDSGSKPYRILQDLCYDQLQSDLVWNYMEDSLKVASDIIKDFKEHLKLKPVADTYSIEILYSTNDEELGLKVMEDFVTSVKDAEMALINQHIKELDKKNDWELDSLARLISLSDDRIDSIVSLLKEDTTVDNSFMHFDPTSHSLHANDPGDSLLIEDFLKTREELVEYNHQYTSLMNNHMHTKTRLSGYRSDILIVESPHVMRNK